MNKIFCVILLFLQLSFFGEAQKVALLTQGTKTNIRGLSVVNDNVLWVSGSNGMVGLSVNGGKHIEWMKVKGFDSTDFRDIEAFSSTEAIIMGISSPAYILKTVDAGKTWKIVYEDKRPAIFLDAMEWWNQQSGIVIGDPIDGKMVILRTFDEGATWQSLPQDKLPTVSDGEACFASSGTNISSFGAKEAVFITGGKKSRFFKRDKVIELPILQGAESTGANSIAVNKKQKKLIIVGGDFSKKDEISGNCAISTNSGKSFTKPNTPPTGYRSCVTFYTNNKAITCGLNGVDVSTNAGNNWMRISTESYNVCRKAKEGKVVYLAGANGRIGKFNHNP